MMAAPISASGSRWPLIEKKGEPPRERPSIIVLNSMYIRSRYGSCYVHVNKYVCVKGIYGMLAPLGVCLLSRFEWIHSACVCM